MTFDKPAKGTKTKERARRARKAKKMENEQKDLVRDRDKRCRFPLCTCDKRGLFLEVSHSEHKGMGGNPAGDRSTADLMIYLCGPRHRTSSISIDKGTLRWKPLSELGADGPIAWFIESAAAAAGVPSVTVPHDGEKWTLIAWEKARGELYPLDDWQQNLLDYLGRMIT